MTQMLIRLPEALTKDRSVAIIKEIRNLRPCGLREAKWAIEHGIIVDNYDDMRTAIELLTHAVRLMNGWGTNVEMPIIVKPHYIIAQPQRLADMVRTI